MHWFMIGLRSWSIGWRMNRGCMDWDNRSCMVNWGVDKRRMMSYRGMNRMMSYRSMDQWCMNNCLNPGDPYCPSTTSDGGGCDCNCDAGDDGCPR